MKQEQCSWHRCQKLGNYIAVSDRKEGTYHLCEEHWLRVANRKGSVQEQLSLLAKPSLPKEEDTNGIGYIS